MTESILTTGTILTIAGISFGVGFAVGVVMTLMMTGKVADEHR